MEPHGYERFGLVGNPFQDLDSESVREIELFHVNQEFDRSLQHLKQEVLDGKAKANIALVGALGTGKTERLLVARSEAERLEAYVVFQQLTSGTDWVVRDLAKGFQESARLSAFARSVNPPKWFARLPKLAKKARKYDPEAIGKLFADVLNENAPSFLLLNDLHAIADAEDAERFMQVLLSLITNTRPGVLVMVAAYEEFWASVELEQGALVSRMHRVHRIAPLGEQEAGLLIAKRLAGKRLVEDLDPLYPFSGEVIARMLQVADANPRSLLRLADKALEAAVRQRAYRIDEGSVMAALQTAGMTREKDAREGRACTTGARG